MGIQVNARDPGRLLEGGLAGIAGGIAFGLVLQAMGLMGTIARLVGENAAGFGWLAHLVIAWVFGIAFALLVRADDMGTGLVWGLAWGVVLWIVAGLTGLHGLLGVPFAFDVVAAGIFLGHVLYGGVLGLAYGALRSREKAGLRRRAPA